MMERKAQDSCLTGSAEEMSLEPTLEDRECGGHVYHEWKGIVLGWGKDRESLSTIIMS